MRASRVGRRTKSSAIALALVAGVFVVMAPAIGGASGPHFRDAFPSQQAATVDPSDPSTNYWALLIGINDYEGNTQDNIGSYQDARDLRKYLLSQHWHADHIVLLANRHATASMIIQSIRWLASKTDDYSVVIFNYSGHEKPGRTSSDGDNETRDVALWASDNHLVYDGTFGREMSKVHAAKMWINLAVCRAGGFNDAGMVRTGRVITFSSPESELSYEDPAVHYTVAGWYTIIEAIVQGNGDANYDGRVSVEEAYRYARPKVVERTKGKQHPFMTDKLGGYFYLTAPVPPPPPQPEPPPQKQCTLIICH